MIVHYSDLRKSAKFLLSALLIVSPFHYICSLMNDYKKIYEKLSQQLTDEEIADAMLIPANLTAEEQKEADEQLRAFRFKLLAEKTEEQQIYTDLLRFRYLMEAYIENSDYSEQMDFGAQLQAYVRIVRRTKKKLAEELDVHYTKLSRILNRRELPNMEFIYKLEEHSGQLVPALVWWQLLIKKQAHEIKSDKKTRKAAAAKVKRAIALGA